ncbi:MAG: cation transporter [Treponema sp.]|nr:cation transporter [Treponema sp.]
MEKRIINVKGMSCQHCVNAVSGALASIAGVADIAVSLEDGTASFSHDPALAPLEAVMAAVAEEGYEVALT